MSYVGPVPEIFRIADHEMKKRYPTDNTKKHPKVIQMPTIDSNPNVRGPLKVTDDFKANYNKKKEDTKKQSRKEYETEIIKLLAKRDRLSAHLTHLDPKKKKDSKKIAEKTVKLRRTKERLEDLQKESGINLNELDTGSKLGRFWNRVKEKGQMGIKKLKKFCKKHKEIIEGVLIGMIPFITGTIFNKIFRR